MDSTEIAALARVCQVLPPRGLSPEERGKRFGEVAWDIVKKYELEACFTQSRPWGIQEGTHYSMRPCGFDHERSEPDPEGLKAMRRAYRKMSDLQRVMVLTLLHLYSPGKDDFYLIGGCPTKISAAEALGFLRANDTAMREWGLLVTHYAGW